MSTIETAIASIQNAISHEETFSHFNMAMAYYGYNNNCYTLMTDHPSIGQEAFHGLATSYPEDWIKYYKEKEYQKVDPVWDRLMQKTSPFYWDDIVETIKNSVQIEEAKKNASQKVMDQAQEAGVADGIGISFVSTLGEIAGIGLSKERPEPSKNHQEMAEIYLISTVFHEKYLSLFGAVEKPQISPREKEVLLWSAEGKTDWEIAEIIGITVPTVRFHWNNIFKKLQVNSKIFATTMAIRDKIITPQLIRPTYHK